MLYVTHGAGGKGRELFNCIFSVQLHHKTTLNNLFKFCVMPGHSIIVLKVTLLSSLSSIQTKNGQVEVPNVNFCLFTAQMVPNLIVVVVKTSQN